MSVEALRTALAAEHAAIFGYGVVGANLPVGSQSSAEKAEQVHRSRRDQLALRIEAAGGEIVGAEAGYALPFEVTDANSAMRLAVALEEGTAGAWREALRDTTGDDRQFALDALVECARAATTWRQTAGLDPTTIPFPGGAA